MPARGAGASVSQEEAKSTITPLWRSTSTAQAFAAAVTEAKWILARGDRRDFVLIDPNGGAHPLDRSIEGVSAKVIRKRMARLDPMSLPSVSEAQAKVRAAIAAEQARAAAARVPPTAAERAPEATHVGEQKPAAMEHTPPAESTHAPPTVAEHADQAPRHHMQQGGHPGGGGMQHAPPEEGQGFNLLERLNRAAMTVPQNLKALVGIGSPVRLHGASAGLAPALATKFDGKVGALAYLDLAPVLPLHSNHGGDRARDQPAMDRFHGVLDDQPRLRRRRPVLPDRNIRIASIRVGRMDRGRPGLLRRPNRGELLCRAAVEECSREPRLVLDRRVLWRLIKRKAPVEERDSDGNQRMRGGKRSDLGAKA